MMAVPEAFRSYGDERLQQAPAFGHGKDGVFEATLVRETGGETRLLRDYTKVPYHLTGTLDNDPAPGLTTLCLQEPTGGVAQGDRHSINVEARADARAHLTTQSATKVHSMRANYAHLDATLEAGPNAHLEYLPGPTILNEEARCLQTTTVDLAESGSVIVGDLMVPDGLSDHDPFSFDHYHTRLEARHEERLICADAVDLRPSDRQPQDPATVGEYGIIGTLYVLAPSEDVESISDAIYNQLADNESTEAGASELPYGSGVTVRILGHRSADVTNAMTTAWDTARKAILGVGAPADRRY
ncbi:urease accessory protein UreD [Natronomonas salina]|uniref:urease accessory protein UreD n=1 Tax=Natronomonas salina TaxID=1710540 RepID=UPI0015B42B03|nr:urease accessory protein UreD [Natronomonas salina]